MRLLVTGLLLSLLAFAQTPPAAKKKSFLDKPTLEAYVRHLFVWPAQIAVAISEPKPSSVDGMLEVTVTGSMGGASQASSFYVSKSGEKVIQGVSYNVNDNPFKGNIDGLKTSFAPGYGVTGAPVVVVIFSDFQCPYCKEEAKMIRSNLTRHSARKCARTSRTFRSTRFTTGPAPPPSPAAASTAKTSRSSGLSRLGL